MPESMKMRYNHQEYVFRYRIQHMLWDASVSLISLLNIEFLNQSINHDSINIITASPSGNSGTLIMVTNLDNITALNKEELSDYSPCIVAVHVNVFADKLVKILKSVFQ